MSISSPSASLQLAVTTTLSVAGAVGIVKTAGFAVVVVVASGGNVTPGVVVDQLLNVSPPALWPACRVMVIGVAGAVASDALK